MNNEIKKTFGPITVDSLTPHTYKAGILQAQLRQEVTTTYPSIKVTNSNSENLFSIDDFNLPDGKSYTSFRVVWSNTPTEINGNPVTEETVRQILATKPNAKIYRQISYRVEDVMTVEQKQAVEAGLRTIAEFQDQLRVRRVNEETQEVEDIPGAPQYRQNFLSLVGKEDEDFRDLGLPATQQDVEHETTTANDQAVLTTATATSPEKAELAI